MTDILIVGEDDMKNRTALEYLVFAAGMAPGWGSGARPPKKPVRRKRTKYDHAAIDKAKVKRELKKQKRLSNKPQ